MEVLFNLHHPDVFAISNSNALFYQSNAKEISSKKKFLPQLFFTKDTDVNVDIKVSRTATVSSVFDLWSR